MMPPPPEPNQYLSQLIAAGIFLFGVGTTCTGIARLIKALRK